MSTIRCENMRSNAILWLQALSEAVFNVFSIRLNYIPEIDDKRKKKKQSKVVPYYSPGCLLQFHFQIHFICAPSLNSIGVDTLGADIVQQLIAHQCGRHITHFCCRYFDPIDLNNVNPNNFVVSSSFFFISNQSYASRVCGVCQKIKIPNKRNRQRFIFAH